MCPSPPILLYIHFGSSPLMSMLVYYLSINNLERIIYGNLLKYNLNSNYYPLLDGILLRQNNLDSVGYISKNILFLLINIILLCLYFSFSNLGMEVTKIDFYEFMFGFIS
jgi:hypothetical protein